MRKKFQVFSFIMALVVMVTILPTTAQAEATLNKSKVTIYAGKSTTITVNGTKKTVTWSSSDKKIATVSSTGKNTAKVTAKAKGSATITAKVSDKKYKCSITVKNPGLDTKKKVLNVGKSFTLELNGTTAKSFSSSDKSVATVSSKGKVTAKKIGLATITAKGADGKTYKCKVAVDPKEEDVYKEIMKFKKKYPTGTKWGMEREYHPIDSPGSTAYSCGAFTCMIEDKVFPYYQGYLYSPIKTKADFEKVKVGDVLTYDNHQCMVIKVTEDSFIVAEGGYRDYADENGKWIPDIEEWIKNSKEDDEITEICIVNWGREITFDKILTERNYGIESCYPSASFYKGVISYPVVW